LSDGEGSSTSQEGAKGSLPCGRGPSRKRSRPGPRRMVKRPRAFSVAAAPASGPRVLAHSQGNAVGRRGTDSEPPDAARGRVSSTGGRRRTRGGLAHWQSMQQHGRRSYGMMGPAGAECCRSSRPGKPTSDERRRCRSAPWGSCRSRRRCRAEEIVEQGRRSSRLRRSATEGPAPPSDARDRPVPGALLADSGEDGYPHERRVGPARWIGRRG